MRKRWVQWNDQAEACPFTKDDLKDFSTGQKIEFLSQMFTEEPLSHGKLETMEKFYGFNAVNNSEIKHLWIRLGLKGHWQDAVPRAVQMVTEQGRMKFLRPLYR